MYVRLCNFEGGAARKPPHISSRRADFRTDREDPRLLPTTGLMVNRASHQNRPEPTNPSFYVTLARSNFKYAEAKLNDATRPTPPVV
jgi:hypothetical protein